MPTPIPPGKNACLPDRQGHNIFGSFSCCAEPRGVASIPFSNPAWAGGFNPLQKTNSKYREQQARYIKMSRACLPIGMADGTRTLSQFFPPD